MSNGQNEDAGAGVGFTTARGRDWPSVRQFNIFVENRVGGLLDVVRRFETTDIHIVSLTVVDSADCAIIRLVLSDPERAYEIIQQSQDGLHRERPAGGGAARRPQAAVADLQGAVERPR